MARSRNIKPGFFKNEVLAELPMETRMLFVGLWTLADREGRMEDRPKRIKMELFAYDSFDVDPMLNQLQVDGFLTRYESNGVRYIQIENFVKHQDPHYKEKVSEIPAPDGVEDIIKATAVTRGQRARILERDEYRCQSCSAESHLCIDHIIPASRGGDSSDDNLQVLCNSCNTKKGNRLDGEERGVKKSQHNPSAVIVQHNVDPTLNQRILPSPSDSLIPDSRFLIPDTKGESAARQPPAKRATPAIAKPDDVDSQTWADWCQLRKAKRATVSLTVVDGARDEAAKAGMSLESFLKIWCRRGSQGLEAEWLKHDERSSAKQPNAKTFAERDREAGWARWEEQTGRIHPDRAKAENGQVIDITPRTLEIPQ